MISTIPPPSLEESCAYAIRSIRFAAPSTATSPFPPPMTGSTYFRITVVGSIPKIRPPSAPNAIAAARPPRIAGKYPTKDFRRIFFSSESTEPVIRIMIQMVVNPTVSHPINSLIGSRYISGIRDNWRMIAVPKNAASTPPPI